MSLATWKKLVAAPVAALLKPLGYRKAGLTWSARRPGVTLLISLQSNKWTTKDLLVITCNLAIRVDLLAREPTFGVWDAHWRERIGYFRTVPDDHWWNCANDEDAQQAGKEIAHLLEYRGLPAMEKLASPEALAGLWASGQYGKLNEYERDKYLAELLAAGVIPARPSAGDSARFLPRQSY